MLACDLVPARFRVESIACIDCDLNTQALPYEPDSFDYVVCVEVIEHLENPYALIRKMGDVLKNSGKLIVTTPNIASITSRPRFLVHGWFDFFDQF